MEKANRGRLVEILVSWVRGSAAILASLALPAVAAAGELRLVSIATGAGSGIYYFAGGELCGLVNAKRWQHGIRCLSDETSGSIDNLRKLRAGLVDFAVVQSDWQYNAVHGLGLFEASGPDSGLRSVVSIYPEALTVVARPGSGITRLSDLVGKRIDIGPAGSGSRATMEVVMKEMGWEEGDFAALSGIGATAARTAICDGEIDAAVFIIAHPNLAVEDMVTSCSATIVPVETDVVARLAVAHPYYFAYVIPGGTYPDQPSTVPVFALAATLVTSTQTATPIVYEVVQALFDDFSAFQASHPAFSEFGVDRMLTDGLSAPLHNGAMRFFREHGLR